MSLDRRQLTDTFECAAHTLMRHGGSNGSWTGKLSSSALATATAVGALSLADADRHRGIIDGGLDWLAANGNSDGGWGDTPLSRSNLSTTLLVRAAAGIADRTGKHTGIIDSADDWLAAKCGSLGADLIATSLRAKYADDRTFSVPILSACCLAGLLGADRDSWRRVPQLPFELAAAPRWLLKRLRLGVVSYALPALIAIGRLRHHLLPSRNPLARLVRDALSPNLIRKLTRIQPEGGGFLEAVPLTSFVTMSLCAQGLGEHPVVRRSVGFLKSLVRTDGSWPIDSNLATWVTTLSVNALFASSDADRYLATESRHSLTEWLLVQQYMKVHPYTGAPAGGWAWTNLPGGVPDADDTAGALLALHGLARDDPRVQRAAARGIRWLIGLQNSDGGMPTFCRGWGEMEFDRSSPDLTAHALLAWCRWQGKLTGRLRARVGKAISKALRFLRASQRADGAWFPLWFGNEEAEQQGNLTYGTSKVLCALAEDDYADLAAPAAAWLLAAQGADGGWGAGANCPPSIEETALAVDALAVWSSQHAANGRNGPDDRTAQAICRGADWLIRHTDSGKRFDPAPIGLYFAKLWYYEQMYPLVFTVSALGRVMSAGF